MSDTPTLDALDARIALYARTHGDAIKEMHDTLYVAQDLDAFRALRRAIVPDRDIIGIAAVSVLVDEYVAPGTQEKAKTKKRVK